MTCLPVRSILFAGLLCAAVGTLPAQEPAIPTLHDPAQPLAEVMILGVFHFHNPNADYAQFEGIDVMSPERQQEIESVVDALEKFAPTRIAVERPVAESDSLNRDYDRYRQRRLKLTANEVHQMGFRLAERGGQDRLFPVDFQMGMPMDSLMAYAAEHDPDFMAAFDAYIGKIVQLLDSMQAEESIGANLRFFNEPANVWRAHEPYAIQATVGADDGYVGARTVGDWYQRNLRIFANLAAVSEPGERVILIIGMGHTPILRHLVETHPGMKLVEAVDYLP